MPGFWRDARDAVRGWLGDSFGCGPRKLLTTDDSMGSAVVAPEVPKRGPIPSKDGGISRGLLHSAADRGARGASLQSTES
jgi:hypothetical protein